MVYKPTVRQCFECQQYFDADEPTRKFCSLDCRNESYRNGNTKSGRRPKEVGPDERWCSYHQEPHILDLFQGLEHSCREGRYLYHIRAAYGLSEEMYRSMLGLCPICQIREVKYVDHDHRCCPGKRSCGECVRGMLCPPCNTAIAALGENEEVYRRAFEWMTKR